ncbi:MAG: hypothetical protein ABIJ26_02965 [Candidatus Margulisiibacteriota bacterium]
MSDVSFTRVNTAPTLPPAKSPVRPADNKKTKEPPKKYNYQFQAFDLRYAKFQTDNPISAGTNVASVYRLISRQGVKRIGMEKWWWGRTAKFLLDGLTSLYTVRMQHEMGHGYRNSDTGCQSAGYNVFNPLITEFFAVSSLGCNAQSREGHQYSHSGGFEASRVLARLAYSQMLKDGGNFSEAMLYLMSSIDLPNYWFLWENPDSPINSIFRKELGKDFGDIGNYLWLSSPKHKDTGTIWIADADTLPEGYGFKKENILMSAIITLIDPTFIYLLYQTGRYLITGDEYFELPPGLPMFSSYLPAYGPEYRVTAPVKINDVAADMAFRFTVNSGMENSYGGNITLHNWPIQLTPLTSINFGASADLWKQNGQFGGAGTITFGVNINYVKLDITGGYKTGGFIPGETLDSGAIFRVDLGLRLPDPD